MPQYTAGVRYIKIAKKDKNGVDQTNTLQSLTEITIPFSTSNITYNIISITEKPTYFYIVFLIQELNGQIEQKLIMILQDQLF